MRMGPAWSLIHREVRAWSGSSRACTSTIRPSWIVTWTWTGPKRVRTSGPVKVPVSAVVGGAVNGGAVWGGLVVEEVVDSGAEPDVGVRGGVVVVGPAVVGVGVEAVEVARSEEVSPAGGGELAEASWVAGVTDPATPSFTAGSEVWKLASRARPAAVMATVGSALFMVGDPSL